MSQFPTRWARILPLLGIGVCVACTTRVLDRVPLGSWGGLHAGMIVSDTGAEIEYDCGAGRITAPLLLTGHGDFDLPGVYIRGGPGPVPITDSLLPHYAARYTGHTDGRTMSLTMSVLSDSIPEQTFTLSYGGNPQVFKCL
ncbi:MAG TPA: hypothetical protein VMV51_10855 [Gemmatimonadaceae bacterium]|nr:hypothetical protein [Gemmatimonadaceae bacterium]